MKTRVECRNLLRLVEERGPLLVYGRAASGKTLLVLALAREMGLHDDKHIHLIATEPQSTLPAASRLLPASSEVALLYNLADIADYLVTRASELRGSILVIDSLTAPYRLEVGYDPLLANRLLGFISALLRRAQEKLGVTVLATSQIHEDPEGAEEPPGAPILYTYFPLVAELKRLDPWTRIFAVREGESNNILLRGVLRVTPGNAELECSTTPPLP